MTLCIAWRQNECIYFASDSRLTNPDKTTITNYATKIFKIHVAAVGPGPEVAPIFSTDFGLCFTGSYLNGSLIADTISEVLSNLQVIPHSDYSIDNLAEIAFVVYKNVSIQLMELNREKGLAKAYLGGFCPFTNVFKLFEFAPISLPTNSKITFTKTEININQNPALLGDFDAQNATNNLSKNLSNTYSYFHILRDIINNPDIPTVGGQIQVGVFEENTVRTSGIAEYELKQDDYGFHSVNSKLTFRGIDFGFIDNELRVGNINIIKTFFNPFESERMQLFDQANELNNNIDI
ncbi:MAG: hypothetical protein EWV91_21450 [Microcystis aeruginosa Ma_QC_Ca_00000000_S207]|uniref:Uncharacterized protein n=1 Tax=Microcystis aeruginosa Ma_QC_Ca_00000000_S207 TaxID=2486251 RepID=A0A552F459_MICAE|nr:MAG: hypothetical protein EWV91_21450 [Microcystis aeruginosa Ma_QC_Ca_00000000_S207]